MAVDWGKSAGEGASGAALGAGIGSIIPGLGTALGAGLGALAGLITGTAGGAVASELESDKSTKKKKWSDLTWAEKAALQIDKGFSDIGHMITGDKSLSDAAKLENILKKNEKGASADAVTSLKTGQIFGEDNEGKEPQAQQGGQQTLSNRILGRPSAINQEASLDDTNFNNNNFSF